MKESQIQRHAEKINRKVKLKKRKKKILIATLSGMAAAAVVAVNLVLFVPYTAGGYDISKYKKSEYYSLMEKIGDMTYHPYTTNNYREWWGNYDKMTEEGTPPMVDTTQGGPQRPDSDHQQEISDSTYEEVTNNQVHGVIESDLFKRSSEYLYYVTFQSRGFILFTYSIASEQLVNKFLIEFGKGENFFDNPEIFLSEDTKTVTLLTTCYLGSYFKLYTKVFSIDVSNPTEPKIKNSFYVTGGYVSARTIHGNFLLATTFSFNRPNFDQEGNYLPQCGSDPENLESFPMSDIYVPEDCDRTRYTNLVLLSEDLTVLDRAALFSYTSEMYVSEDRLFVARAVSEWVSDTGTAMDGVNETSTEIVCYSHEGSLEFEGMVKVKGTIENQYSMDEYQDTLRVVTTYDCVDEERPWHPECNLYVYDLKNFEQVAAVLDFSDPGESVKSVRFDGEKSYVCTAKEERQPIPNGNLYESIICDPVFEFDLSDLQNITWKDTGEISGYSMSLTKFKDGTLLGIGEESIGTFRQIKIEIYRTEENAVVPIARYLRYCTFAYDYKAYFIDAERGLVGFEILYYEGTGMGVVPKKSYVLLKFDGEKLELVQEIPLLHTNASEYGGTSNSPGLCRACLIGEKLYVVDPDSFEVIAL